MTKKRFIKLLMSHGEQIHTARTIAVLYNSHGIPYKKAYSDYLTKIRINKAFSRLAKATVQVGKSIQALTLSLGKLNEVINDKRRAY